jgi:two-component system cell cycle sensor histidine kinase/response regulator CckA
LGTTFEIYLPGTSEVAIVEKSTPELSAALHGTATILLVEDEKPLRELTSSLLTACGYTVLSAEQPDQALEIVRQHPGSIHLLLTDMVMPGMSGQDLAKTLTPLMPGMRVVYMSGYTGFTHPDLFDSDAIVLFKPIPRNTLLCKVYEVLAIDAVSYPS